MSRILGHIRQLGEGLPGESRRAFRRAGGIPRPLGRVARVELGDPPSLQARRSVLFALLDAVPGPDHRACAAADVHPRYLRRRARTDRGDGLRRLAVVPGRLARRRPAEPSGRHGDLCRARMEPRARAAVVRRSRPIHALRRRDGPLSAGTPIAQVVRELELLHATYLNSGYHRERSTVGRRRRIGRHRVRAY